MRLQQTVAKNLSCIGVGLHTGEPVTLTLRPAPTDSGIVFVRHKGTEQVSFGASIQNLLPSDLCTAIGFNGSHIKTVEHILSALAGLEVDNVFVDLDAGEVPVMDGSAGDFVRLIRSAGIVAQDRCKPFLRITEPIEVVEGDRSVRIEPFSHGRITYTIQYNHPLIQTQTYVYDRSVESFEQEIAEARTFAFLKEVEALWARGLGRGGSFDNTIVLSDRDIINESGLRFRDEFVRHKVLDLMGDLALLGIPIIGHLIAERSGHALHTQLVEKILAQPDKWVLVHGHEDSASTPARPSPQPSASAPSAPLYVAPAL